MWVWVVQSIHSVCQTCNLVAAAGAVIDSSRPWPWTGEVGDGWIIGQMLLHKHPSTFVLAASQHILSMHKTNKVNIFVLSLCTFSLLMWSVAGGYPRLLWPHPECQTHKCLSSISIIPLEMHLYFKPQEHYFLIIPLLAKWLTAGL